MSGLSAERLQALCAVAAAAFGCGVVCDRLLLRHERRRLRQRHGSLKRAAAQQSRRAATTDPARASERRVFCLRTTVPAATLEAYKAHHRDLAKGEWPEVAGGLVRHGVESLRIWAPDGDPASPGAGDLAMVMVIETRGATSLDALGPGSAYRTESTRVAQWESMMDGMHGGWHGQELLYELKAGEAAEGGAA